MVVCYVKIIFRIKPAIHSQYSCEKILKNNFDKNLSKLLRVVLQTVFFGANIKIQYYTTKRHEIYMWKIGSKTKNMCAKLICENVLRYIVLKSNFFL